MHFGLALWISGKLAPQTQSLILQGQGRPAFDIHHDGKVVTIDAIDDMPWNTDPVIPHRSPLFCRDFGESWAALKLYLFLMSTVIDAIDP